MESFSKEKKKEPAKWPTREQESIMLSEIYDGMNSERLTNKQKNHRRKEERYGKLQFKKKKKNQRKIKTRAQSSMMFDEI